jgi:hypothetical protein
MLQIQREFPDASQKPEKTSPESMDTELCEQTMPLGFTSSISAGEAEVG